MCDSRASSDLPLTDVICKCWQNALCDVFGFFWMSLDVLKQIFGGVGSLSTAKLRTKFPANREINREFRKFGGRIYAPAPLSPRIYGSCHQACQYSCATEQGIITPVTGNGISLLPCRLITNQPRLYAAMSALQWTAPMFPNIRPLGFQRMPRPAFFGIKHVNVFGEPGRKGLG
jgi:hypothetical protein